MTTREDRDFSAALRGVEHLIEEASNNPECFKCQEPITELTEVRIVTVRVDGEPKNVWVHADHANPAAVRR